MIKRILLFILFFTFSFLLIAREDVYFYSKERATVYKNAKNVYGYIEKEAKVTSPYPYNIRWYNKVQNILVSYGSKKGYVPITSLYNKGSDSFSSEILNNKWIPLYYIDVIKSGSRERLYHYEPGWKDFFGYGGDTEWWNGDFSPVCYYFYNVLFNTSTSAKVKIDSIKKKSENLYILDANIIIDSKEKERLEIPKSNITPFNKVKIILKRDGDLLELFLGDESNKFAELFKADETLVKTLHSTLRGEKVDLSKIKWPQRASKEQTKDTTTQASKKNYLTTTVNRLRFRATPTLDGRFIRHLKAGERLELIERGKTETIGDTKGTWVKVKTTQGEVGWCFDAYLKVTK